MYIIHIVGNAPKRKIMDTTQEIKAQQEIVKKLIPTMRDEIIALNLPENWTMTIQKIQIHKLGNVETALEYAVLNPCGCAVLKLSEMPESVDDAREDILRAASKSMNILKSDNGMIPYMAGRITDLEKRGNIYKSKNAWARGF